MFLQTPNTYKSLQRAEIEKGSILKVRVSWEPQEKQDFGNTAGVEHIHYGLK